MEGRSRLWSSIDWSQSFGRNHQDWSVRDPVSLTGDDSNGNVSVFEVLVPVGQKLPAPAHKNDAYEEILYGIEGVLTWTVDGTPIEVGPGQALCIPRGAVHRFDNLGSEDVKQLVIITPAIMGPAYFREAAEVINAGKDGRPTVRK